jgi:hypothetical protein
MSTAYLANVPLNVLTGQRKWRYMYQAQWDNCILAVIALHVRKMKVYQLESREL